MTKAKKLAEIIARSPVMPYNPVVYDLKEVFSLWGEREPEFFLPSIKTVELVFFDDGECYFAPDGKLGRMVRTNDIQAIELTDGCAFHSYAPDAKVRGRIRRGPGQFPEDNPQTFFDRYGVRDRRGEPRQASWSNFVGGAIIMVIGALLGMGLASLWRLLPVWYFKAQGVAHVWDRYSRHLWGVYDAFTEEAAAYLTLYAWIGAAIFALIWLALLVTCWDIFGLGRFARMARESWVYSPSHEKIVFLFMRDGERIPACVTYDDVPRAIAMHAQLNMAWGEALHAAKQAPSDDNQEFYL